MLRIPPGLLDELCKCVRIDAPITVSPLLGGVVSGTYLITDSLARKLVLSVGTGSLVDRSLDASALSAARLAEVRVPPSPTTLFEYGEYSATIRPFVPDAAAKPTVSELYSSAGHALARIHGSAAPFRRTSIYADLLREAMLASSLGDSDVREAESFLLGCANVWPEFDSGQLSLTHGDFKRGNWVFTDESDLCVLDWEKSCSFNSLSDLAFALVHCGGEREDSYEACRAFLRGYAVLRREGLTSPELVDRFRFLTRALLVHDWCRTIECDGRFERESRSEYLEVYVRDTVRWSKLLEPSLLDLLQEVGTCDLR